jgi:SAM-dependent methyltransferase
MPYHKRQFDEPYRSTLKLGEFLRQIMGPEIRDVLDVGCGAGANIHYLSQIFPNRRWTGVDIAGEVLFPVGRPRLAQRGVAADLVEGSFYDLTGLFPDRKFDLVLSIQTLMTTEDYADALSQLLAVTRRWLVVTSLFTHFNVDARIAMMDYTWPENVQGPFYYSVFSIGRFRRFCETHGCGRVITNDFDIDIDLPVPEAKGLGTYTRQLAEGPRLQFSGPVLLPWKFVAVEMDH